jgi:hypothetical protein
VTSARELDRDPPDAAGRAGDEHAFAEHGAGDLERPQRGQACGGQGRCLRVGDAVGDRGQPTGRNRGELGPGPGIDEADDASAPVRAAAVGGGALDHACRVPARDRSFAEIREAGDLAAVEREGPHPYQRLIRERHGLRDAVGQADVRGDRGRRQRTHGPARVTAAPTRGATARCCG